MILWISIGNSDDKLGPAMWSEFIKEVDKTLSGHAMKTHASMVHSLPTSPFMNCHWCIEIPGQGFVRDNLWKELEKVAKRFRQESIAWNECKLSLFVPGEK